MISFLYGIPGPISTRTASLGEFWTGTEQGMWLRIDYVRTFYHADWRDPTHYHLTVGSAVWGERGTADLILWALEHIPQQGTERSR